MAKRVNTKFLLGLTVAIAVAGGVGFAVKLLKARPDPDTHVNAAKKYIDEKNYELAWMEYSAAWQMDRGNKDLCIARGEVATHLVEDQAFAGIQAARTCWENALEIDPHYKPALEHLLDSYVEQLEYSLVNAPFNKLQDVAARLVKEDPQSARAQTYLQVADLGPWLAGVAAFDERKISATVRALAEVQKKDPSNVDAMYYLGRARLRLARDERQTGQNDKADAQLADLQSMLDAAVAALPANVSVNYRAFLLYSALSAAQPAADRARTHDAAGAALARARQAAKIDDRFYPDIAIDSADWEMAAGKSAEAEKPVRDFYQQRPNSQLARVRLAEVLRRFNNPAKRDEAIHLLEQPIVPQHEPGMKGLLARSLEQQTRQDLLRLRVDQLAAATQPADRDRLIGQVDQGFKQVSAGVPGESLDVLRLRASIEQAKGQPLVAVQTLKQAVELMERMATKPPYQHELIYQLATAYRNLGQNRAAEERYLQVLAAVDNFAPARINLIDLYINERNFVEAARHLEMLKAQSPQSPELSRLNLALASRQGDAAAAKQFYAALPEDTAIARDYKAEQAMALQDYPEVVRLVEPAVKEKPGDPRSSMMLAGAYYYQGQKDAARAALADAIAHNPADNRLKIALQQVEGATREQLKDFIQKEIVAKQDPFSRELQQARSADAEGRYDQALLHLKAADALKPSDLSVWATYFDVYVRKADYASAARAADVLAPLDADTGGAQFRFQLAMAQRHFDEAIKIARQLTDARGAVSGSWSWLGQAYQSNGQFNDAILAYRAAMEIQNTNPIVYTGLAQCYNSVGQPDQARQTLAAGYARLPQNRQLREMLMAHDTDHGNARVIVPLRERLLKDEPDAPYTYYAMAYTCMAAADQTFAANLEESKGYLTKAREALATGVEKFPRDLQLNAKLAELLQKTASFEEGQQVLTKLAAAPEYADKPEPLLLLADYFAKDGRADQAEQYLRQAWVLSGKNVDVELRLARHLAAQQKWDQTLEVLKANPDDPAVLRSRLQTLVYAKRLAEAEKGVDAALAKTPESSDLLLVRLGIYVDQQRFREARAVAAKVLKMDPRSSLGLYFQALAEMRDPSGGDLELAKNDLSANVTRNPRDSMSRLQLAEVYLKRREIEPATQHLEELLKTEPLNREVRFKLLQLYMDNKSWTRFEQTVGEGELNPKLNSDPIWFALHATAFARQGAFDKAIEKIKSAMEVGHGDPRYDREYLDILIQAKNFDDILAETDRVMKEKDLKAWWLYQARGLALAGAGDTAKAAEEFDQALAAADAAGDQDGAAQVFRTMAASLGYEKAMAKLAGRVESGNSWRLLAVTLQVQHGDWQGALQTVSPLLDKRQTLPPDEQLAALKAGAEAYQVLGQGDPVRASAYFEKSRALYVEWLDKNPVDRQALNNMAYLLAEGMKKPLEARQFSQRAYEAERRNGAIDPGIADTHGWVLTLCGGPDADLGLTLLRNLVQDNPEFIEARYHLGMALLKKQRAGDAQSELATAAQKLKDLKSGSSSTVQLAAQIAEGLKQAKEQAGAKTSLEVR